jgi:hypothetical protein
MIFRWTLWGKDKNLDMLKYSVDSFIACFGKSHRYILYTDNVKEIDISFIGDLEIYNFNESKNNIFNIESKATWKKWYPKPRIDIEQTEVYIDSDVFMVEYPKELDQFIKNEKYKFAIMDEFNGQAWQHGAMEKKNVKDAPFVNAGLFIQKAGFDITEDLLTEYKWWKNNVSQDEQTHHDEQGALAIALTKYNKRGELFILPKDKYPLISDHENKDLDTLDEIVVFHATWPEHPAFYRFKDYLNKIIYTDPKSTVAILMSVRDEESYIDFNISYHLDIGFDYIFIVNHCSKDNTGRILESYKNDPRVIVIQENDPVFDHAKICNKLLNYANKNYKIDWFIFLDADEFLSINEKNVHSFVNRLEQNNIPYATIGWANALFDHTQTDYRATAVNTIDTMKYYYPWPEKEWQEYGHFRKTIIRNHKDMEIVVGGHYVKTENNLNFFGEYHWNPFIVPASEAKLLHFEFRDTAEAIYKKWEKLADFEKDSTSSASSPWLERISTIRKYVNDFRNNIDEINKRWFFEHRTFWGTIIPKENIIYDLTLAIWYGKYFRRKIESGKIKSVCLVRSGNLGDVIMTEPVAKFLSIYVPNIYLATDIEASSILTHSYRKIYKYNQINSVDINCDIKIKLVYEFSDNTKTYIQGYMDSIGFGEIEIRDIPVLDIDQEKIIDGKYILIAPLTSSWQENKRNWGYEKFLGLSKLLESTYNIKCVILEKSYAFSEMVSLVKHCQFFVGNDSGPAIIAQSFNKKSFIIFGATQPKYLHLLESTVSIYDKNRHKLCTHKNREEEINCCEEFCMKKITVEKVFEIIKQNIHL